MSRPAADTLYRNQARSESGATKVPLDALLARWREIRRAARAELRMRRGLDPREVAELRLVLSTPEPVFLAEIQAIRALPIEARRNRNWNTWSEAQAE